MYRMQLELSKADYCSSEQQEENYKTVGVENA